MRGFRYGFLGWDTKKMVKVKGLLQGLEWVTTYNCLLVLVEGDSQLLINLAIKLQSGTQRAKVAGLRSLEGKLELL